MDKKKAAHKGTAQKDDTEKYTDPLAGWHALAKPLRDRLKSERPRRRKGGGA